jgi:hypothetical protein
MYHHTNIEMNSIYFINSINEPDSLIRFIEDSDSNPNFYKYISKWKTEDGILFEKNIDLNNIVLEDEKVLQRVLYIKNSFISNINFCKDLYSQSTNLDCGPILDIKIYKKKPGIFDNEFSKSKNENVVNVYVILNSDADAAPFCVSKEKSIYFRPDAASIVMISDSLDYKIGENTVRDMVYAKTSFTISNKEVTNSPKC